MPNYAAVPLALAVVLVTACRSSEPAAPLVPPAPTVTAPLDSAVTLAPGTTMLVTPPGILVTFDSVTSESRCPTNALIQCVWAGLARISLRVGPATNQRVVSLETMTPRDTVTIDRYVLRLVDVSPHPLTLDSIPKASYRATLTLTAK